MGVQLELAKQHPPGGIAILSLGQCLGSGRLDVSAASSPEKAILELQTQNAVAFVCCTHSIYNSLSLSFIHLSFNIHILGESNRKSIVDRNSTRKRLLLVYIITTEFEYVIVTDIQTHFENKNGVSTHCYCHLLFSLSSKHVKRFSLSANWHLSCPTLAALYSVT